MEKSQNEYNFLIPITWFVSDIIKNHLYLTANPHGGIQISATKNFTQIGVLNIFKNEYLAFKHTDREHFVSKNTHSSSIMSHVRNQQTKEFLMLTHRTLDEGSSTHVYFGTKATDGVNEKVMNFNQDYINAIQDV